MATKKKIWSVYEVGASYEGPLTEVEASSERSALDSAASHYGVSRSKLYVIPGALLTGLPVGTNRQSNSTKRHHASKLEESPSEEKTPEELEEYWNREWIVVSRTLDEAQNHLVGLSVYGPSHKRKQATERLEQLRKVRSRWKTDNRSY